MTFFPDNNESFYCSEILLYIIFLLQQDPGIYDFHKKVPDYILYLGRVVPYTAMGLLIVYCLRDVQVLEAPHALPEIISLVVVVLTYLWKRNSILSVVIGTVLYMVLVQMVF